MSCSNFLQGELHIPVGIYPFNLCLLKRFYETTRSRNWSVGQSDHVYGYKLSENERTRSWKSNTCAHYLHFEHCLGAATEEAKSKIICSRIIKVIVSCLNRYSEVSVSTLLFLWHVKLKK